MVNYMVRQIISFILLSLFTLSTEKSIAQDTLRLNKVEAESVFLQNNLMLLAEHLSISKAEARLIQAKVWPNPTLTVDQVNLWKPSSKFQAESLILHLQEVLEGIKRLELGEKKFV